MAGAVRGGLPVRRAACNVAGGVKWDPHGVLHVGWGCPQVRLRLTRGYRKFAPYGAQASRLYVADFPCGGGLLRVCLASLSNRIHH